MLQGTPQFTPRQLLDAGRRSETEGKTDFAVQFYLHLAEHYGQTPEAVEARTALSRMATVQRPQQVWQSGSVPRQNRYRSGRALAALFSGVGWLGSPVRWPCWPQARPSGCAGNPAVRARDQS
jgi:hypothetical protein